jgi:hypothetical protein
MCWRSPSVVGLGLAVVARLVDVLGGQFRVNSEVTKGSQFSVLIPFAKHQKGAYLQRISVGPSTTPAGRTAATAGAEDLTTE